ncbi:MAG TPA: JAB domain-containing protein [Puia sp.]|jgi:DNA repair protein RadC|nr:JAB domain-containing protein [Puia sp.]
MEDALFTISEIEIRYNPKIPALHKAQIKSSNDAYRQFMILLDENAMNIKEEAAVLFLNRGNRVIGGYKISVGGITGTVVDIRIILGIALKSLGTGIILAHTHPSGELKPSKADMKLTDQLNLACKIMEITLHDHLIITSESYYSFEDEGLL